MLTIPVPEIIQRRAWETAYVLRSEFPDRLADEQFAFVIGCDDHGPEVIAWRAAGRLFRLWALYVGDRV